MAGDRARHGRDFPGRRGDDNLHVGDDGAAEGRAAHPRQLHRAVRGRAFRFGAHAAWRHLAHRASDLAFVRARVLLHGRRA